MGLAVATLASCAGSGLNKAGGSGGHKALVLTLANPFGDSEEVQGFAGEVSRLSGGTLRVDVKNRWRYGQVAFEDGLIRDVRAGKADLGVAGSRAWDSVGVSSLRALGAPFLIDSYPLQERVLRSRMIGKMLRGLRRLGLVGIGVLPGPLRRPLGIAHPLLKPSDFVGLRIGVQQSRLASATMRALGAKPVWFPVGGAIAGMGGIEQHVSSIQGEQYDKLGHYLTANAVLWPRPLVVFASRKTLERLTARQQRILVEAATEDDAAETKALLDGERTDTAILCRRGRLRFLTASAADLRALRQAVQPVYATLERDPQTRADIEQIERMRGASNAQQSPSCGQTAKLVAPKGPLDGVYRSRTSLAQLRASNADPASIVPENYGTVTFVFDRGRFAQTQENKLACTWGYGTFAIRGNKFEWLYSDGGGIAPTGSTNKPGELAVWRWSLYRDEVTLVPVVSGPATLTLTRISTSPSARYLSKRCPPPTKALPR
jgi:TRAP-type C4-dicarboxylate transport system substrate-binding protein